MRAPESPFESYKSKGILFFGNFIFFLGFRAQSAKKPCLHFSIFNCSKKLQNIFEIGLTKLANVQKSLWKKKYFEINKSKT